MDNQSSAMKDVAEVAKHLYDELLKQFDYPSIAREMTTAAMPTICAEVFRANRPMIVFGDTAETIEESLKKGFQSERKGKRRR